MNASLCYYKGFNLRSSYPFINKWLTLFENTDSYRGTQGDFHTHAHDLPPQMGGCFKEKNIQQASLSELIDNGEGLGNLEFNQDFDSSYYTKIAIQRVLKHRENITRVNPYNKELFEESLRSVLTYMVTGDVITPKYVGTKSLRYLKNRISVPRDMPIISARLLRQTLKKFEDPNANIELDTIPVNHRFDQNPSNFNK